MEQEIEGVIQDTFDIGVVEQGIIYILHFERNVLYYLIVPLSISRCKVALGHPEVHEPPPPKKKFCEGNGLCRVNNNIALTLPDQASHNILS